MIAIVNTAERNAAGEYRYELRINQRIISEFWHLRDDGLYVCLLKAAEAAKRERHQIDKLAAVLREPKG